MKRLLIALLLVVTTLGVWAEGNAEATAGQPKPVTLRVFWSGSPAPAAAGWTFTQQDIAEAVFHRKYPSALIEYTTVDISTGADKTMRAAVAAGNAPDLYIDTWVRAASYIRTDFAADLRGLMGDLDDYLPGVLDTTTRGGEVLGLPFAGDGQALAVNLAMCREAGFAPANWATWTLEEFYQLAELVKAKYGGKKWVTGFFAANQSGDYLLRNWAATFGAKFYANGDYTKTAINTPEGIATLSFFRDLTAKGYVRSDWIGQTDDDYVLDWANGKLATAPFYFSWIEPYFKGIEALGGKRFDYAFVPFPRAPGIGKVPVHYTASGGVVPEGKIPARVAMAAAFLQAWNGPEAQVWSYYAGNVRPNRKSVVAVLSKPPQFGQVQDVMTANGIYDLGPTLPLYAATRPLFPAALQRLMQSPKGADLTKWTAQVLTDYERDMNAILSGK